MLLDLRTLIIANLLLSAFMGSAMLFYRANQKTYAGFGLWAVGIFSVSLLCLSMLLYAVVPVWVSIVLVNIFAALGFLFWLDGSLLFMKGRRLDRRVYLTPFFFMFLLLYFHFVRDSATIRNVIFTAYLMIPAWYTAFTFLSRASVENGFWLARAIGILFAVDGVMLAARIVLWVTSPGTGMLDHAAFHSGYFAVTLLLNGGVVLGILMLNSRRLENELIDSRRSLDEAHRNLKVSVAEVRALNGLLPICSFCKKIRDDQGYWQQLEKYIRERSPVDFSHAICPDCLEKHFPAPKRMVNGEEGKKNGEEQRMVNWEL